ncbi:hypothetical protein Tco_0064083 [Tanacetum coccineum]
MLDEFAPPKFFAYIRRMEHDQLFTEFNVGAARQISLSAEVRMRAKYNIKEKRKLRAEAEAAEAIRLRAETSKFEAVEKSLRDEVELFCFYILGCLQFKEFQDVHMRLVGEKLAKLEVDLSEITLHFEEKFYPHLITTIVGRRWLLTHGLKLFINKCFNSFEYLSALGAAISRAIDKGMQDGLAADIEHGARGRRLEDLIAYNPSAEEDYNAALQELHSVDFSLLAELKSHKDASVETIMNLLRLESPLIDAPGMSDLQPDVDQLMVPIHRSEDQAVLGSTSLLFALSVSRDRVERIRKNIAEHRSALTGVYVPLVEPLSIAALEGTAGTSGTVPDTTTALSVTFASTSTIPPISTDDYEIVHTDGQEGTDADGQTSIGADTNPFPSIDDAELNVPE